MLKEVVDNVTTAVTAADTLDVDLFRQFRDDVLLPTETGSRFVDLYYRNAPEVMPLLLFERTDIGLQALTGLTTMQSPLRNLLDGDGSEIISQALVDTITVFLDGLMAAASDSLRDSLQVELARLGPLQDVVGLPVAEAVEIALGTPTHVDDARIQVPNDFVLQQNYPNPFNPATSIQYSVSSHQFVSLKVYDVLGKEVATLVDERKDAGKYTVSFDGTGLASGIYFAELQADKQIRWRKMLLVR